MRRFDGVLFDTASRLSSALAVLAAAAGALLLLVPEPLGDVFFAGWVLFAVVLAFLGAIGAWTNRTPVVWVAALLLTGLAVVGMWSIGLLVAPAALFLLVAAVCSQLAGPREDVRAAILATPPTRRDVGLRAIGGLLSIVAGGSFVYVGAFARELFDACARETLACAIENANWGGIGLATLGLLGICLGAWLLWKQYYVTKALAGHSSGRGR